MRELSPSLRRPPSGHVTIERRGDPRWYHMAATYAIISVLGILGLILLPIILLASAIICLLTPAESPE